MRNIKKIIFLIITITFLLISWNYVTASNHDKGEPMPAPPDDSAAVGEPVLYTAPLYGETLYCRLVNVATQQIQVQSIEIKNEAGNNFGSGCSQFLQPGRICSISITPNLNPNLNTSFYCKFNLSLGTNKNKVRGSLTAITSSGTMAVEAR